MALKFVNVEACLLLGSAQDNRSEVERIVLSGKCRVLYITPESLENCSGFLETIDNKVGICLVAVDECHCVSQWGNDFRPAYRNIGSLKKSFQILLL